MHPFYIQDLFQKAMFFLLLFQTIVSDISTTKKGTWDLPRKCKMAPKSVEGAEINYVGRLNTSLEGEELFSSPQ